MADFSNSEIAQLLRTVSTALTIKKANIFQSRAYDTAADAIEHLTIETQDLWEEGKLDDIPGVGASLQEYLDELFKTGTVKHFETLKKGIPDVVFELINVPGVGPKTAMELADMGIDTIMDLQKELESGGLIKKGLSEKRAEKLKIGLSEYLSRNDRMLLAFAGIQADRIIEYLKKSPDVEDADALGSLRRQVVTVGDLDFAASSKNPEKVIEWLTKMPGVKEVVSQGEGKIMVVLGSGLHVDLLVGKPESYGALLQHFTGSKHHNIKLRTYAEKHNLSLSEYGVKHIKTGEIIHTRHEDDLYKMIKMQTPPPEIREDNGEIEAALAHKLPTLVEPKQIKGDFHLHSNFPLEPSHGPGANSLEEIVEKAIELGYDYVGLSDHSPGFTTHSPLEIAKLVEKRTKKIEQIKYSYKHIRVQNGLEIDILPDGTLSVPNEVLVTLDYCVAGVHSVHKMSKEDMTERILKALSNPYVHILAHPTIRIINKRNSCDADWDKIFDFCAKNRKLLEINASPSRMDLREDLVRRGLEFGVHYIINTDAHELSQMDNMRFGVSVARRGWTGSKNIVNTNDWTKLSKWFNIKK